MPALMFDNMPDDMIALLVVRCVKFDGARADILHVEALTREIGDTALDCVAYATDVLGRLAGRRGVFSLRSATIFPTSTSEDALRWDNARMKWERSVSL